MNKKLFSFFSIALILGTLLVGVAPVTASVPKGPTSLIVSKTIDEIVYDGWTVFIYGVVKIKNDQKYLADIWLVVDEIQAKAKGGPWTTLNTRIVTGPFAVSPGDKFELAYFIEFHLGEYKAYRNVVTVTLGNHPKGPDTFTYRVSFERQLRQLGIIDN